MDTYDTQIIDYLPQGYRLNLSTGYTIVVVRHLKQGGFANTYLSTCRIGAYTEEQTFLLKEYFPRNYCRRADDGISVIFDNNPIVDEYRAKFRSETEKIAAHEELMNHPNIVKVIDRFSSNGTEYYVMEYLSNGALWDIVKQRKSPLTTEKAINYFIGVCDALEAFHNIKMIHNDISPSNIAVDKNDVAKLIDFGISKTFNVNGLPNTIINSTSYNPDFCSPDQLIRNDIFIPESDIYSLGATLYFVITGKIFNRDNSIQLDKNHVLYEIIYQSLNINNSERCKSAKDFKKGLEKARDTYNKKKLNIEQVLNKISIIRKWRLYLFAFFSPLIYCTFLFDKFMIAVLLILLLVVLMQYVGNKISLHINDIKVLDCEIKHDIVSLIVLGNSCDVTSISDQLKMKPEIIESELLDLETDKKLTRVKSGKLVTWVVNNGIQEAS